MFSGVSQLSEPNKLLIHASFVAQAPSVWDYNWVSAGFSTTDNSKSSLQGALSEWCANATAAEEVHGHVSTWDVTAVTDMSSLLGYSCRSEFNEDVNAWDVSQVTSVSVSLPAESGRGGGACDTAEVATALRATGQHCR